MFPLPFTSLGIILLPGSWYVSSSLAIGMLLLRLVLYLWLSLKGSEWKEKAENLQVELQQCYKAQSRLSEQLVVEVAESRTSKALAQEKENAVADLQKELTELRFVSYAF